MLTHLADVSVRSILLSLPAAIGLWILGRRATAALRHAVWATVMCGMLALFALSQTLPRLPLRILERPFAPSPAPASITVAVTGSPISTDSSPAAAAQLSKHSRSPIGWAAIAGFAYCAISLAFLIRFVTGIFLARKLAATANPVLRPGENNVYESDRLTVPVTIGWLRPKILLPRNWHEWDSEKREAVLAHESAHARRRDGLVAALAGANRCIFWFHPLAWILERRLALFAEQACDESCIVELGDRRNYARVLLEMATVVDASHGRICSHALTMAAGSHIRQRIESLLEDGRTFSPGVSRRARAALILCGIPAMLCAGAVDLAHQPPLLKPKPEIPHLAPAPPVVLLKTPAPIQKAVQKPIQLAQVVKAPQPQSDAVQDEKLTFEVVSIKPAPPDDGRNMRYVHGGVGDSQVSYENTTLFALVREAYPQSAFYEIVGAVPQDSPGSPHYNVIAKLPPGITRPQLRIMMQNMLAERFGLTTHSETREFAGYNLVVAKDGPRLKEAVEMTDAAVPADRSKFELDPDGFPKLSYPTVVVSNTFGPNGVPVARMAARAQPLSVLLPSLHQVTGRPVQDKTGLTGKYDFTLEYGFGVAGAETIDSGVPDIRYAIKSLGLAVEPMKINLDVLVVDHIEKNATPN